MVRVLTTLSFLNAVLAVDSFGNAHRHQQMLSSTLRTERELYAKLQKIPEGHKCRGDCGASVPELEAIQLAMDEVTSYITDEISAANDRISAKHAAVDACNTAMGMNHSTGPPSLGNHSGLDAISSFVNGLGVDHETCRSQEVDRLNSMNAAEVARDNYSSAVFDANPALTAASTCSCSDSSISNADECQSCTTAALAWHDDHVGLLRSHIAWYQDNVTAHANKVVECNGIQGTFEREFCVYATHLTSVCNEHETCYRDAVDAANAEFDLIPDMNTRFNDLCFSVTKVKCFVQLFLDAGNSSMSSDMVKSCVNTNPSDCSNVNPGNISSKNTCDQGPIATLPGDAAFTATFYANIASSSPTAATVSCS